MPVKVWFCSPFPLKVVCCPAVSEEALCHMPASYALTPWVYTLHPSESSDVEKRPITSSNNVCLMEIGIILVMSFRSLETCRLEIWFYSLCRSYLYWKGKMKSLQVARYWRLFTSVDLDPDVSRSGQRRLAALIILLNFQKWTSQYVRICTHSYKMLQVSHITISRLSKIFGSGKERRKWEENQLVKTRKEVTVKTLNSYRKK